MLYTKVTVTTTSSCADLVSMILVDAGSEGTSIVDAADIREVLRDKRFWDYCDEQLLRTGATDSNVYVSGYFAPEFNAAGLVSALEALRAVNSDAGSLECLVETLESSDWENEWKKYYEPITIDRVTVVPKWLPCSQEGINVLLDPGMAFGTGKHETTCMCIRLLQKYDLRGKTVYDIGCGSGILGITAAKLGAQQCIMSDIDDNAIVAARENSVLNGVVDTVSIENRDLLDGAEELCDCVVANITADVLLQLRDGILRVLRPGGVIIISGLIHARAEEVRASYAEIFTQEHVLREGEWQAFAFRK